MRGSDGRSGELFSYVDLERRVRPDHPLRPIRDRAVLPLVPYLDTLRWIFIAAALERSAAMQMLSDYAVMREQARACGRRSRACGRL